jgi:MYXO-CTERM domain-containing protein
MTRGLGLALVFVAGVAHANTLEVGPGRAFTTIAAAAAATTDGDTVLIDPGTYHEAVTWSANGLHVAGSVTGTRPVIDMTGMVISNGKAIFVTDGADITIEGLELVGASVTDQNGAGIRWEGSGSLTVRDCVFRGNEDGILGGGGAHPENTALIERNEFVGNGLGDFGFTHSVYFGDADTVTFTGNWSHALTATGSDIGHLFKSRAHNNFVLYNRLTAEDTHSSYEVNIPQGGEAYVIGNLIQQRVGDQRIMISFADGDGPQTAGSHLYVVNNTFVSESNGDATFIRTTAADAMISALDNLLVGPGTLATGGVLTMTDNVATMTPGFVDQAGFDYHLVAGSPAIDSGFDPGSSPTMSLAPVSQYVQPLMLAPRSTTVDVGAYELAGRADGPPGISDGDTPTGNHSSGCCSAGRDPAGSIALALALALWRKRRRKNASKKPA